MSRIIRKEEDGRKFAELSTGGMASVTFINKQTNKQPFTSARKRLENNDRISLVDSPIPVFIYFDPCSINQKKYPKKLTDEYLVLDTLGEGAFGKVKFAMSHEDCTPRAVKQIDLVKYKNKEGFLNREVDALRKLEHPCIIRLFGFVEGDETDKYAYIIMEYANGGEMPKGPLSEKVRLVA